MPDFDYVGNNNPDGEIFGQTSASKIAFHGLTPTDQPDAITDASVAHALNATFSDVEAEAALNALGTKINSILAALREKGLIAS